MKKICFNNLLILSILIISCKNNDNNNEAKNANVQGETTKIEFEKDFFDFGTIKRGEKVAYNFKFKNVGKENLLIIDVIPTCGCTSPKWTKEIIPPDKEGRIEIVFDSSGYRGVQMKEIKVKSNSVRKELTLTIRANVLVE